MENKTTEELQSEFERLTALMVSKMSNLNNIPQSDLSLVHMDLNNIEKEKNVIKMELERRASNN